jgi:hypothetical protein
MAEPPTLLIKPFNEEESAAITKKNLKIEQKSSAINQTLK